ncbi:MAG: cupin domain-containing protein [Anaerolineae bacterium]|nr:cupin domain-containing protein [Anaerolineae bacterium]
MGVVHHFKGDNENWDWEGVPVQNYGPARPGVSVRRFISGQDNSNNMELRYFELEPGACSNFEQHNYEHAVLVLRGQGTVCLGEEVFPIRFGDAIFVEADEIHQFRAAQDEALGFMCAVLDKELRVAVHGEQKLVIFDDESSEPNSGRLKA